MTEVGYGLRPHPGVDMRTESHLRSPFHWVVLGLLATAAPALADSGSHTAESTPTWPQLGGHWGIALPIAELGTAPAAVIGRDFFQFGLTPGLTVKLDEKWAVDFEFIAFSRWQN